MNGESKATRCGRVFLLPERPAGDASSAGSAVQGEAQPPSGKLTARDLSAGSPESGETSTQALAEPQGSAQRVETAGSQGWRRRDDPGKHCSCPPAGFDRDCERHGDVQF